METDNVICEKSYAFALRIVKLFAHLQKDKGEFILSRQVIRSGTSIGANVEEAMGAQSDKDFLSKMTIAYKETRETRYWLQLLRDSGYLPPKHAQSILNDCEELLKILGKIKISTQNRIHKK
jgi:four helix bundle protein